MVNATKPTQQSVSLLGGLLKIVVDNFTSLKSQLIGQGGATINGTKFFPFNNPTTNTTYSVPASTNLQIWGFDSVVWVGNAANTLSVAQFGYADDTSGTNFVSLYDLKRFFVQIGTNTTTTTTNAATGLLTVPTGKFPIIKTTDNATTDTLTTFLFTGLETN